MWEKANFEMGFYNGKIKKNRYHAPVKHNLI